VPTLFTATAVPTNDGDTAVAQVSRTVLASVLDRLSDRGTPAHRVWSPPFTVSPPLDAVLRSAPAQSTLAVPIGLVDKPFEQRRDALIADLSGAGGNVAVVGGPRSGKSTALRTLVLALAATRAPQQVQVYGLDFGGGTLSQTRVLPHVGSVAGRHQPDLVRRIVAELRALVHRRETQLLRGAPDTAVDDSRGEVFLVVDGWAAVRQEFDGLEESIAALAAHGLSVGVHVVVSASRWTEIRPALKDLLGTRIELRLGDPTDSEMDRMRARLLSESPPGRGITRSGLELVVALPRLDGTSSTAGLDAALHEAAEALRTRHPGASAPPVELLPTMVAQEAVVASAPEPRSGTQLVIGLGESELRPLVLDFTEQSHLLILGESGSGKTATLRTMCREVMRSNSAEEGRLVVVDYRRTLLGVVESDHLAGYAMSQASVTSHIGALARTLETRKPPDGVTQKQLRDRSWWSGPEIFVIVDDYDLVASAGDNPLLPLVGMLPHARDIGLHVVLARRSGGAARAMFDPMLGRMRELGCMGLMMSASPEEGPLFGSVRPTSMPSGRGVVVRRGEPDQVVQVGWVDPS
jgi:S-DNA-T family DNA segregation ATPase FtsK/SpoIIIE